MRLIKCRIDGDKISGWVRMELRKFLADKNMYIKCILNEIASRNCRLWYVIEIETGKTLVPRILHQIFMSIWKYLQALLYDWNDCCTIKSIAAFLKL